jgi:hypothetical protein
MTNDTERVKHLSLRQKELRLLFCRLSYLTDAEISYLCSDECCLEIDDTVSVFIKMISRVDNTLSCIKLIFFFFFASPKVFSFIGYLYILYSICKRKINSNTFSLNYHDSMLFL